MKLCGWQALSGLMMALGALVLTGAPPAAAQGTNLLANPGFEGSYVPVGGCANVTGSIAPGWEDNTCWDPSQPRIEYARDTVAPHGGASAQRVVLRSGSRVQLAQFLPAAPAPLRRLQTALWLKAAAPMRLMVQLREADAPYRSFGNQLVQLGTGWTRHEFDAITLGGATVLLLIAEQPGTFWVDDAALVDAGAVSDLPQPPPGALSARFFGMHFNYADTPWPALVPRIGSVRIWDADRALGGAGTGAQWADLNPAPGVFDWSGLDARVATARARGAEVVYTLGGRTPRWASAVPDAPSPYGPGQCGEPATDAVWQDWVRTVVTRYRGQVRAWEIWNEPDLQAFFCGNPLRLVSLAQQARAIVRQVDPAALVVSPAISGFEGPGWLDLFFAQGGGAHVDVVAVHGYVDRPEDLWHKAALTRLLLARWGLQGKPLWNTEQGWLDAQVPPDLLPPAEGAAWISRTLLVNWAWGFGRLAFYTWDNGANRIPLTGPDRRTLTEAGIAWQQTAAWMAGRQLTAVQRDAAGTWIYTLRQPDGSSRWLLWNPDTAVAFLPPAAWNVRSRTDLQGRKSAVAPGSAVAVGGAPQLLGP